MSTGLGDLRAATYVATRCLSRQTETLMNGLREMSMGSATLPWWGADSRGGAQT
jgi:hypothetical protein